MQNLNLKGSKAPKLKFWLYIFWTIDLCEQMVHALRSFTVKGEIFKKCLALQEALKDAFNVFDKDGSGLLDKKTFNDFLRKTGDGGLSDQQV